MSALDAFVQRWKAQPGRAKAALAGVAFMVLVLMFLLRSLLKRIRDARDPKRQIKKDRVSRLSSDKSSSSKSSSHHSKHSSSKHHHSRKPDSSLPTLCVLVGIHGSGKTTWAKQYVERVRKSAVIISSDEVRYGLTGSPFDYSRENEVEEALLKAVAHEILLRRTVIVDDCQHNLKPLFRVQLLALAKEGEYNRVLRRFAIKPLFARTRIDKDLSEGKPRHNPTAVELEALASEFAELEETIKQEGWIEDK